MNSEIIGIIDLGSNSTRLVVYEIHNNGAYQPLYEMKRRIQLASWLDENMCLQEKGLMKAIQSTKVFVRTGEMYGVTRWIPVATAAIRQSANQAHILHKLKTETGLSFEVLQGDEEGRLGYLGVINTLPIDSGLLFDIGGASTELMAVRDRRLVDVISVPFGALTLTEQFNSMPIERQGKEIYKLIQDRLSRIPWMKQLQTVSIVGLGGAARALGKLDRNHKNSNERLHGYQVSTSRLQRMFSEILTSSPKDLTKLKGISKRRTVVIVASFAVIQAIADTVNARNIMISRSGLREGLFFQYMLRNQAEPVVDSVLEHSVANFQKLYKVNPTLSALVSDTVLALFDALLPLHGLGANERRLLQVAAQIESCGRYINSEKWARHSAYLTLTSRLNGLQRTEYQIIADLLCGGKDPAIQKLSLLLRLAKLAVLGAGIKRDSLTCSLQKEHVLFGAAPDLKDLAADWGDAEIVKDFETAFGRKLLFTEVTV